MYRCAENQRDFHAQEKKTSLATLQAHTDKGTCSRDSRYVTKANIKPEEEFKTEIHSIKREAH